MTEPNRPSAKIIADSISEQGRRLTTMEVVMHRFVLAEMNTHRVFSRNSASSRAIPFTKIKDRVDTDPAYPVHWGREQKGMQSGESFSDYEIEVLKQHWDGARDYASICAEHLHESGLHKSLINRLMEPFMWHTAIISSTEWANFFNQRCHPDAQPEMKAVADAMQRAYYKSTPKELTYGEWHLPYIDRTDWVTAEAPSDVPNAMVLLHKVIEIIKRVSVARCARVSYLTHDGIRSHEKDLELYQKLRESGHWSPFEHVATPVRDTGNRDWYSSNFIGWKQYRKEFPAENQTEFVPNLPDLKGGPNE
jgi:thymidylate synthase ThyX